MSGDGFQYHLSQLTFSDEWYCPQTMHLEDVALTPGPVTFPPPGFDSKSIYWKVGKRVRSCRVREGEFIQESGKEGAFM